MSTPQAGGLSAGLPHGVLAGWYEGNRNYPQCDMSIVLLAGSVGLDNVAAGKSSWDELVRAVPSAAQVDGAIATANFRHNQYGQQCRLGTAPSADRRVFARSRLAGIMGGALARAGLVAAMYGVEAVPRLGPMPLEYSWVGDEFQNNPNYASAVHAKAVAFFEPQADGSLRPEAAALHELWRVGARVLRASRAMEVGSRYKQMMQAMALPDITPHAYLSLGGGVVAAGPYLHAMVRHAWEEHLPDINERTGFFMPEGALRALLKALPDTVNPPRRPAHISAETLEAARSQVAA